jgi:hypothetical protein
MFRRLWWYSIPNGFLMRGRWENSRKLPGSEKLRRKIFGSGKTRSMLSGKNMETLVIV